MIEKAQYDTGSVYLTFLYPDEYIKLGSPPISSVHCFPLKEDGVLFTINPRGIDIIGGHVEKGESICDTLIRESKEEGCITPTKFKFIGVIEVDNKENPLAIKKGYPMKGYQAFFSVLEYAESPFIQTHECVGRKLVDKNDIKDLHHNWLKVHQKALDVAFSHLLPESHHKCKIR